MRLGEEGLAALILDGQPIRTRQVRTIQVSLTRGFPVGNLALIILPAKHPGGSFTPGNTSSTKRGLFTAARLTNLHSRDCKVSPSAGPLTSRSDSRIDVTHLLRPERHGFTPVAGAMIRKSCSR